ncbi:MAG: hypothetical protein R3F49_13375 [Planctomycetota bacterium]
MTAPPSDDDLRATVAAVAADYGRWGRLEAVLHVAPTDCRAPLSPGRAASTTRAMWSAGPEAATEDGAPSGHGKKLYSLYARDPAAYRGVASGAPQRDQVIVKATMRAVPYVMPGPGSLPSHVVQTEEGLFVPGEASGLFMMIRATGPEEGEAAWRYATVSPEGEITAAGRIASCVRCHAEAPHGGLFGLGS